MLEDFILGRRRFPMFLALTVVGAGTVSGSQHPEQRLRIELQTRHLVRDEQGMNGWETKLVTGSYQPSQIALLICDMWDRHWSRGATSRVAEMAPRVDELARVLRSRGVSIVHSPSDTMDFYADYRARQRAMEAGVPELKPVRSLDLPPLPIDDSDGGSDTGEKPWYKAWSRQHPAIQIDDSRDLVSADAREIFSYCRSRGIRTIFYTGVHTNMCILKSRSFSLKPMAELGMEVILVRDLTDTMYNPAQSPYVSHDEGTRLVIEYIEKFLCPTVTSRQLLAGWTE